MRNESLVILSAGKPHKGDLPALLSKVNGKSIFDWQVNALSNMYTESQIILGYSADSFKIENENVKIRVNSNWEFTGSGGSLFCADLYDKDEILVSYSDIIYRTNLVEKLKFSRSDITIVYDSSWKGRYVDRSHIDLSNTEKVIVDSKGVLVRSGQDIHVEWAKGEFIGLVKIQGEALKLLKKLQEKRSKTMDELSLSELIEWFRLQGFNVCTIDVLGDWAELNNANDIAHFILGTKAETLSRLSNMVKHSTVMSQVSFTVAQWNDDAEYYCDKAINKFSEQKLVVRSSARSEDAFTHSNAGAYTSLLNISPNQELYSAVDIVIASYKDCQDDDQVLIQPMVENVHASGVAFTRTLEHSSPFYVINYDESGDTESITSGTSSEHKSLYFRKDSDINGIEDPKLRGLLIAIREVEELLNYDSLDIEFAIDIHGIVYLLQARPIVSSVNTDRSITSELVLDMQKSASLKWSELQAPGPKISGDIGLFGVMPDWNPAEIIGTNPGKLAFSLYKNLILNEVWATQRAEYGYKDVRPQTLLREFAGKPYIDVRASFNSFIPKGLCPNLEEKLVNFYLSWLQKNPALHDKVEFEVVPTCFGPNFARWESRLKEHGRLNDEEIQQLKKGLLSITRNAISRTSTDIESLQQMRERHDRIVSDTKLCRAEKISLLLETCKKFGTLPFAHLARSAFVAVTLLRESVELGWLSHGARDGFLESIKTVSHELSYDAWLTSQGKLAWEEFVSIYGHLRPGTYDVTSPSYKDDPKSFLKPIVNNSMKPENSSEKIRLWELEKERFFGKLNSLNLGKSSYEIETFMKDAIEGREKSKFIFTKSLSEVLTLLRESAPGLGISLEELANLSIETIQEALETNCTSEDVTESLKVTSSVNMRLRKIGLACHLPPLLRHINDFSYFVLTEETPNFIGSKRITEKTVYITEGVNQNLDVSGCIVLIPQADPGYDWLFGQKIAGLITMYGGANSHMAIRSAEFGLPAAIGVGEKLFTALSKAKVLELDSSGQTIRVIS